MGIAPKNTIGTMSNTSYSAVKGWWKRSASRIERNLKLAPQAQRLLAIVKHGDF